jgi:hypothetical protein
MSLPTSESGPTRKPRPTTAAAAFRREAAVGRSPCNFRTRRRLHTIRCRKRADRVAGRSFRACTPQPGAAGLPLEAAPAGRQPHFRVGPRHDAKDFLAVLSYAPETLYAVGRSSLIALTESCPKTATSRSLRLLKWQPDAVGRHDLNLRVQYSFEPQCRRHRFSAPQRADVTQERKHA